MIVYLFEKDSKKIRQIAVDDFAKRYDLPPQKILRAESGQPCLARITAFNTIGQLSEVADNACNTRGQLSEVADNAFNTIGQLSEVASYDNRNIYISIAHTKGILAVAMSFYSIGVDVESSDRATYKVKSIAEWTQLEAYAKYCGTGLTTALVKGGISIVPSELITTFENNGYCISVCSEDKELIIDWKNV